MVKGAGQDSVDSHVYLRSMFFASWLPWQCPSRGRGRTCGHVGPSMVHAMVWSI